MQKLECRNGPDAAARTAAATRWPCCFEVRRRDASDSTCAAETVVAFIHEKSLPIRLRPWPRGHERSVRTVKLCRARRHRRVALHLQLSGAAVLRAARLCALRYARELPGGPLAIFHDQAADAVIMERRDE